MKFFAAFELSKRIKVDLRPRVILTAVMRTPR